MTIEDLSKLTPEQKRVKCAELLGISNAQVGAWYGYLPNGDAVRIPDYGGDLNAMHEAEKLLTPIACMMYERKLAEIIGPTQLTTEGAKAWYWHATAAQRLDALLLTLA